MYFLPFQIGIPTLNVLFRVSITPPSTWYKWLASGMQSDCYTSKADLIINRSQYPTVLLIANEINNFQRETKSWQQEKNIDSKDKDL